MGTLAERIRKALDLSGKSQAELAKACGIKAPSVNDWLSGKTKSLKAVTAHRAADFFGVSMIWLTEGRGPMHLKAAPSTPPPDLTMHQHGASVEGHGHKDRFSQDGDISLSLHDRPVITTEEIMGEEKHKEVGIFRWVAQDDHMAASRRTPILCGYHVALDADAEFDHDDTVLVRIQGGPPMLRKIVREDGDNWWLAVESGAIPPRRFDPEMDEIVGVMITAFTEPRKLRKKPKAAEKKGAGAVRHPSKADETQDGQDADCDGGAVEGDDEMVDGTVFRDAPGSRVPGRARRRK